MRRFTIPPLLVPIKLFVNQFNHQTSIPEVVNQGTSFDASLESTRLMKSMFSFIINIQLCDIGSFSSSFLR